MSKEEKSECVHVPSPRINREITRWPSGSDSRLEFRREKKQTNRQKTQRRLIFFFVSSIFANTGCRQT